MKAQNKNSCLGVCFRAIKTAQESARQTNNQRKGQNEKFMNFAHKFVNSGVFIEKGPFFHGKGASRAPQIPQTPPPPPPPPPLSLGEPLLDFQQTLPPVGRGRGGGGGELESARGPFTVKKRPLLDENALILVKGKVLVFFWVWPFNMHAPYIVFAVNLDDFSGIL